MENEIVQLISTVGFPIVACVGLFYLYDKTIKDLTITLNKIDATLESMKDQVFDIKEYEQEHHQ